MALLSPRDREGGVVGPRGGGTPWGPAWPVDRVPPPAGTYPLDLGDLHLPSRCSSSSSLNSEVTSFQPRKPAPCTNRGQEAVRASSSTQIGFVTSWAPSPGVSAPPPSAADDLCHPAVRTVAAHPRPAPTQVGTVPWRSEALPTPQEAAEGRPGVHPGMPRFCRRGESCANPSLSDPEAGAVRAGPGKGRLRESGRCLLQPLWVVLSIGMGREGSRGQLPWGRPHFPEL